MYKNHCACGCGNEIRKESTWAKGHNPNKAQDRFDWSNVEKDFIELGTLGAVAKKYNCSSQAVYYQLEKRGVDTNKRINTDRAVELYKKHNKISKVAELLGCSTTTVKERLKAEGHKPNHDNKNKNTVHGIGRLGEMIALQVLEGSKDMNEEYIQHPYDIEWKGKKIDVKTSRIRRSRGRKTYSFNAKNKSCTHYLTVSLDDKLNVRRIMIIPKEEVSGKTIYYVEEKESKWDKYIMEVKQ